MSEAGTLKGAENEAFTEHQFSAAVSVISGDIARMTKLNRMYVSLCMISCVGLFGLLVAKMFLFK